MSTSQIQLDQKSVDLWLVNPNQIEAPVLLDNYLALLNESELAKQSRYRFAKDRHDALVTRAFVRTLLSHYTGGETYVEPADWVFSKGEKGKPELVEPPLPLRFNISHATGLICCAVALNVDVGVDVEYVKRKVSYLNVADYKFSAIEAAELNSQPQASQKARFFDYWTLKESYIKAVGGGLSIPLDQFSFHIKDDSDISLSFDPIRNEDPADWQSWLFHGSDEHRIALSIKDPRRVPHQVRFFQTIPMLEYWPISLPLDLT